MKHSYSREWGTTVEDLTLTIHTPHNWLCKALLLVGNYVGIDLWHNQAITKQETFKDAAVVHLEINESGVIGEWVGKKEGE